MTKVVIDKYGKRHEITREQSRIVENIQELENQIAHHEQEAKNARLSIETLRENYCKHDGPKNHWAGCAEMSGWDECLLCGSEV